jgi:hypothetical protein
MRAQQRQPAGDGGVAALLGLRGGGGVEQQGAQIAIAEVSPVRRASRRNLPRNTSRSNPQRVPMTASP